MVKKARACDCGVTLVSLWSQPCRILFVAQIVWNLFSYALCIRSLFSG